MGVPPMMKNKSSQPRANSPIKRESEKRQVDKRKNTSTFLSPPQIIVEPKKAMSGINRDLMEGNFRVLTATPKKMMIEYLKIETDHSASVSGSGNKSPATPNSFSWFADKSQNPPLMSKKTMHDSQMIFGIPKENIPQMSQDLFKLFLKSIKEVFISQQGIEKRSMLRMK